MAAFASFILSLLATVGHLLPIIITIIIIIIIIIGDQERSTDQWIYIFF